MSPLKNHSTTITADRSASEIAALLARHGAESVLWDYGPDKKVSAISFRIKTAAGVLPFRLPANAPAVQKTLYSQYVARRGVTRTQASLEAAQRVAWRILKNWVEAQMALIEVEMVSLEQVFLSYMLVGENETLYERLKTGGFKMLAAPRNDSDGQIRVLGEH